jgi:hypothetical protein
VHQEAPAVPAASAGCSVHKQHFKFQVSGQLRGMLCCLQAFLDPCKGLQRVAGVQHTAMCCCWLVTQGHCPPSPLLMLTWAARFHLPCRCCCLTTGATCITVEPSATDELSFCSRVPMLAQLNVRIEWESTASHPETKRINYFSGNQPLYVYTTAKRSAVCV